MNSKFTQKAQHSLKKALELARELGHTYIGSEHLLLGIMFEKEGAAAKILLSRGASYEKLKETTVIMSGSGTESDVNASDMTPCVKKIIEESANLSNQYGQNYIGTEHLLLALLGETDSVGMRVLELCSISVTETKNDLIAFLGGISDRSTKNQQSKKPHQIQLLFRASDEISQTAQSAASLIPLWGEKMKPTEL
jgi:ATP-dependent Clp protease ATP-binding subunit ClpC